MALEELGLQKQTPAKSGSPVAGCVCLHLVLHLGFIFCPLSRNLERPLLSSSRH